jgi:transposase-like protein
MTSITRIPLKSKAILERRPVSGKGRRWCSLSLSLRQAAVDWGQMKGHGTKFGRKKEAAIAALLTARNIEEAAKSVGIARNTLLNWMAQLRLNPPPGSATDTFPLTLPTVHSKTWNTSPSLTDALTIRLCEASLTLRRLCRSDCDTGTVKHV